MNGKGKVKGTGKIKWIGIVRVLGLALVLGYHLFGEELPGGFLGVDMFFTFSGYLITALAVEELIKKGGFNIGAFFKRRFLRIFPPLFFAVMFTLPLMLLISPDFSAGILKQIAAVLGFVTNYYEIMTGGTYEAALLPHMYIHTWSLAAEAQYYIVWAIILKILSAPLKNKPLAFRWVLGVTSIVAAVLSYEYMQIIFGANIDEPTPAYFDAAARATSFFIGSAAGALLGIRADKSVKELARLLSVRIIAVLLSAGSAAMLIFLSLNIDFANPLTYRAGFIFASMLTAILILAARILHESTPIKLQEPKLLSAASDLSYCVFLFHWPVYIVFSNIPYISNFGNIAVSALTLSVSVLFSMFVFYCVEPLLQGKQQFKDNKKMKIAYSSLSILAAAGIGLSSVTIYQAPQLSSLEQELIIGFMYQDYDRIYTVKGMGDAIKPKPLETEPLTFEIAELDAALTSDFLSAPTMPASPVVSGGAQTVSPITPEGTNKTPTEPVKPPQRPHVTRPDGMEGILSGVTVIGDSVCLGARKALIETIPNCTVDAAQNRQIWQGYELIMELQESGLLTEYVVIALGTNTNHNAYEYIDKIIADIMPGYRLIFVTPFNGNVSETSITYKTMEYLRTLPDIYPFVTIADWAGVIGPQKEIIGADTIHIGGNRAAINIYVEVIQNALAEAATKPAAWEEPAAEEPLLTEEVPVREETVAQEEAAAQGEPTAQNEPATREKPTVQNEPTAQNEPTTRNEPAT